VASNDAVGMEAGVECHCGGPVVGNAYRPRGVSAYER
jgi:hypothetical protein